MKTDQELEDFILSHERNKLSELIVALRQLERDAIVDFYKLVNKKTSDIALINPSFSLARCILEAMNDVLTELNIKTPHEQP